MKASIFDDLYFLENEVNTAAARVSGIYNSIDSYKSIKTIHWVEKKSYCGGFLKKMTHYKTTHHSRDEVVFDTDRFNQDLGVANAVLQEQQCRLNQVKLNIQADISSARNIIHEYNSLQNTNKVLENQISTIKSSVQLSNSSSLVGALQSFQGQKNSLEAKKKQYEYSAKILPQMIKEKQEYVIAQKSKNAFLTKELEEQAKVETRLREGLHKKVATLDSTERAKLVYKAVLDNKQELLDIVKAHGYWSEFTAYIAVAKDSIKVFDYCLGQNIDLDSFIEPDTTLAKYIISSYKKEFIDKMFFSGQELKVTAYIALMHKDFTTLELLINADDKILEKIRDVDACGLSAMQLAIAKGDIELVKFVKVYDKNCLNEEFIGYKNALEMSFLHGNNKIIKEIAIGIGNVKEAFLEFVKNEKFCYADQLIELRSDELTPEYLETVEIFQKQNESEAFNMFEGLSLDIHGQEEQKNDNIDYAGQNSNYHDF